MTPFRFVIQERADSGLEVLGKFFRVEPLADVDRVVAHADFPDFGPEEARELARAGRAAGRLAVTGCLVQEDRHPFRLMVENASGRLDYLCDIDQSVRGARQRYPAVHRMLPAGLYVPAGTPFDATLDLSRAHLHLLERSLLLDMEDLLDRLEREALRRMRAAP